LGPFFLSADDSFREVCQYAEQAMQGMQLLFLSFSRDDERQADALGVEYAVNWPMTLPEWLTFIRS
jgi:predicted Zn-dependent protease